MAPATCAPCARTSRRGWRRTSGAPSTRCAATWASDASPTPPPTSGPTSAPCPGEGPPAGRPLSVPFVELAWRFGVALGLGLLLGLERERSKGDNAQSFAGARTFALIALVGATAFDLQHRLGVAWALPLAFAAVGALTVASYVVTARQGDVGATTEVTALLTFLIGGLCGAGEMRLGTALAVTALLLLSAKSFTHRFVARVEPADVEAVLKFAVITV